MEQNNETPKRLFWSCLSKSGLMSWKKDAGTDLDFFSSVFLHVRLTSQGCFLFAVACHSTWCGDKPSLMAFSTIFYCKLCRSRGLVSNKQLSWTFQVTMDTYPSTRVSLFYHHPFLITNTHRCTLNCYFVKWLCLIACLAGGGGLFSCMQALTLYCFIPISFQWSSSVHFSG